MSTDVLWAIAYATGVWLVLWAANRWLLSRLKVGNAYTDMTETELKATIVELERRLSESERKNKELEGRQDFLVGELRKSSIEIGEQAAKIIQLSDKVKELEMNRHIQTKPLPIPTVLLVAPSSNLPMVQAETEDVQRSGLQVIPAYSPVSQLSLTREMRASKADGLWLVGHMDAKGDFPLDGGQVLSASALTSLVRGRYKWVFLNACQSVIAAQQLQNETGAIVICTILDVLDEDAYRTGSLFAGALAQTRDPRAAYDASLPGGNRVYLYLGGRGT